MGLNIKAKEKQSKIDRILKEIYPVLKNNERRWVLLKVMAIMKMEGIVKGIPTQKEKKMIQLIVDSIVSDQEKFSAVKKRVFQIVSKEKQ